MSQTHAINVGDVVCFVGCTEYHIVERVIDHDCGSPLCIEFKEYKLRGLEGTYFMSALYLPASTILTKLKRNS